MLSKKLKLSLPVTLPAVDDPDGWRGLILSRRVRTHWYWGTEQQLWTGENKEREE